MTLKPFSYQENYIVEFMFKSCYYILLFEMGLIANSSACTTTELSELLTSCLTTIENHVIKYCEQVYNRSGKNLFWSIKNSCEVLNKLKSGGFRASICLHTIFLHYILPCPTILLRIN